MDEKDLTGYQVAADDVAVKTSGRPVAIYSIWIDSGAGGGGIVTLHNGTGTGSTTVLAIQGTTGGLDTVTLAGGQGIVFPSGCFVETDANVDSVTIAHKQVQA